MAATKPKNVYKIMFHNNGNTYELHAREISQNAMYAFVEVADIIFGERSQVVVDPADERLKAEFSGVKRTYIPLHSIIRIDEVEKEGPNRVMEGTENNVTPFPMPVPPGKSD